MRTKRQKNKQKVFVKQKRRNESGPKSLTLPFSPAEGK